MRTENMRLDRLKSKFRGTIIHRLYRIAADTLGVTHSPRWSDQSATYDRQTVEVMRRVLRHDSSCVDMGAHTGEITQHMVTMAPAGTHYAFEPLPHLAAHLRQRFPGVLVHETALSDSDGEAEFQYVQTPRPIAAFDDASTTDPIRLW
jgi:hypothetical protein